ncbi:MAG TPA: tyrosine--tRNA ligase [Kofleriaceae bacterium]|jgi:tyrosyl-tRNA synthetase
MSAAFLDDLHARGLLADVTDREGLAALLAGGTVSAYAGYDPTSASLHIGNLVPTILLKRLQDAGHRPIIVVGGATGMVGDPSGKSDERNLLDDATLEANVAGIRAQLARLLAFEGPTGAALVNNADWTRGVGFLEFLRDIGKHLTVNYMMAKDSVASRLEGGNGISYTEFSYMLLQAFDFVQLAKSHGCRLQVGGSDQYGNITAGCELSRKMGGPQLFGLTAPLLLDSTGQKMGKTSKGERIWLDAAKTSPYEFYQYWRGVADADAPRLLRLFSLRPLAELAEVTAAHEADPAKRLAQIELARTLTAWVHGPGSIAPVEAASRLMFESQTDGITDDAIAALAGTVPTFALPRAELAVGLPILDLAARAFGDSKGALRRLIQQGGLYLNHVKVASEKDLVNETSLLTPTALLLRSGRAKYLLVRAV